RSSIASPATASYGEESRPNRSRARPVTRHHPWSAMSLALVLLASTLAGNVDTTNLWTGIPKELGAVSLTALDGKASPYSAIAKKVTVISFYSSVIGDPRDAQ